MIGGELDSGDIISRDYYPINLSTKITQVWDWISITVPKLFYEALKNLEKDPNFLIEKQSKNNKKWKHRYLGAKSDTFCGHVAVYVVMRS